MTFDFVEAKSDSVSIFTKGCQNILQFKRRNKHLLSSIYTRHCVFRINIIIPILKMRKLIFVDIK